jgi:UDP-N-acetyl-D-galactosamine dehydrogenase
MAVAHKEFRELGLRKIRSYGKPGHVLYDIKYVFKDHEVDGRL